jgi:cyanamide hydratase
MIADNVGLNPHLIHKETIESVTQAFPRMQWSGCFASTLKEELELKPWAHTTVIEGFAERVLGNDLMAPYE